MNRAETYEYIEDVMIEQLGDDFEVKNDVDGCETRFEWQGDAFYRRLDVTVTSRTLIIRIGGYRNLNENKYAFFSDEIGKILIDYDDLVESLVTVSITTLAELTVEDLFLERKRKVMTTRVLWSDEFLNDEWEVPHTEVEERVQERERESLLD